MTDVKWSDPCHATCGQCGQWWWTWCDLETEEEVIRVGSMCHAPCTRDTLSSKHCKNIISYPGHQPSNVQIYFMSPLILQCSWCQHTVHCVYQVCVSTLPGSKKVYCYQLLQTVIFWPTPGFRGAQSRVAQLQGVLDYNLQGVPDYQIILQWVPNY